MRLAVVSGGLGSPSSTRVLADQLAAAVRAELDGPVEVSMIELREHAHALVDNLLTGFPPLALKEAIDTVVGADGLIAVTPVFSASYNALFKAFFDVLDEGALAGKPVLIAATGGTERHSLALEHAVRPLFGYLRAYVAPTAVYAATSDFGEFAGALEERVSRAAKELATMMKSLPKAEAPDGFENVASFDELMAG